MRERAWVRNTIRSQRSEVESAMLLQPIYYKLKIIDEGQLRRIEFGLFGNHRKFTAEPTVFFPDYRTAWNRSFARRGLKPVPNMANRIRRTLVVCFDVLPTDVGDETFVSIWCTIHDQTAFLRGVPPKSFRTEKDSEFQWHIESGQLIWLVFDLCSRNVVDAVIALVNQTINVLDSNFARIGEFQCASRHKTASGNTKYDRLEKRLVLLIERAVDEDASAGGRWHSDSTVLHDQENLFSRTRSDPGLVPFRVGSLQFRDFSNRFSDYSLGNSSVSLDVADWPVFSRRHAVR